MVQAMGATHPPPVAVAHTRPTLRPGTDRTIAITFHLFG
jgi:hypothetical protein